MSYTPMDFLRGATSGEFQLALTQLWGSAIEAFRESTVLVDSGLPIIATKQIGPGGGKTHQFYMHADLPAPDETHTPGDTLMGQQFEVQESTITVDEILPAHYRPRIDHMMLQPTELVASLGPRSGKRIARAIDQRAMNLLITTARMAAVTKNGLTVHNGGNRVERVGSSGVSDAYPVSSTGALNFRADVAELAQLMDEDNVPEDGRYLFITPYIRRVLGMNTDIFNVWYGNNGQNRQNSRLIGELEGFQVIVAKNRIPSTNVTSYTRTSVKYNGDYSRTGATGQPVAVAACGARDGMAAIGRVNVFDMMSSITPDEHTNTVLVKNQVFMGMGSLMPACAGVIEVDDA